MKTRLKPKSNTNQIIIFSGLMILLQQESYERSIILGASCKHVCSNITLLIWQQTNDRLTTFTVLMRINAGKKNLRLRGRSSLWTQRLRIWLITCLPFSNQYLLHCCKYYGRTQYGRGSLVVLKLRIAFGWRLWDPVGVRYFRKFGGKWFKDIFAMSANGSGVWFW